MNRQNNYKSVTWLFISSLILFLSVIVIMMNSCNQKESRFIRKNANSLEAQQDIEAMNKALRIMREKDCVDPISWYYQGAIHWIPDTIKDNKLCDSYQNVSQLKTAWDNCTHSPSGKEKIHFLVWHRLYIWHFEKIVRKLSGKNDFALPYWAYTNSTNQDKIMPKLLREKSSALYTDCRYDSVNLGFPISGEITRALDLTKLMSYKDYHMFCLNINAAPHGAMHDYIGAGNDTTGLLQFNNPITNSITNTGLMGWVPTAGFDPVFWLHHSNIDRIWQQWTNSDNGKNVTLDELKSIEWPYVFFDENGKKVEYTYEDVIEIIYQMDYDFDDTKVRPSNNLDDKKPLPYKSRSTQVLVNHNPNCPLIAKLTQIDIKPNLTKLTNQKFDKKFLEITVTFTKVPRGVYEVYLNDTTTNLHPSNSNFVGFMNFFGFDSKTQSKSCRKGCCTPVNSNGKPFTTFLFEVNSSTKLDNYQISIYKHNRVETDLTIENIKIIAQ